MLPMYPRIRRRLSGEKVKIKENETELTNKVWKGWKM
jgi:hypothetical protein